MYNLPTLVTGTRPARFMPAEVLPLLCPSSSAVSCKREVRLLQCGPLGTVVSPPLPPTRIVPCRKSIAMVACPRFAGETGRLPDAQFTAARPALPALSTEQNLVIVVARRMASVPSQGANHPTLPTLWPTASSTAGHPRSSVRELKANAVVGSGCTVRRKTKVRNPVGRGMYPRS
jgi:hypothetical protein